MSGVTTIGRWIHLPTAAGASDRFRADEPLGSGTMQILSSNGELAARENECRTIWEHPGSADCYAALLITGDPEGGFNWYDPTAAGAFHHFCGVHRLRRYGSSGQFPRLQARARLLVAAGNEAGIILRAYPVPTQPSETRSAVGTASTTSATFVDLTATVTLREGDVGSWSISPRASTAVPVPAPGEVGASTLVAVYVGVYNPGGSGAKATVRGITVSVIPPA